MSVNQAEIDSRCGEIQVVITEMYKDYYMLQEIEKYNQAIQSGKYACFSPVKESLEHIAYLLKNDLGLSIWKIYYEGARFSNSLSRLTNELNKERKSNGLQPIKRANKDTVANRIEKPLQTMRNTVLAHLDLNRNNSSISIADLKHVLDMALDDFNLICDALLVKNYKVSKIELGKIEMHTALGFGQMINGALVDFCQEEQGNI